MRSKRTFRLIAAAVLMSLLGCGGDGDNKTPKHCSSEGYPLWCSAIDYCCTPGHPYACRQPDMLGGNRYCRTMGCPVGHDVLDYCGED